MYLQVKTRGTHLLNLLTQGSTITSTVLASNANLSSAFGLSFVVRFGEKIEISWEVVEVTRRYRITQLDRMLHKSLNMLLQTILVGQRLGQKLKGKAEQSWVARPNTNKTPPSTRQEKFHNLRENLKIEALAFQQNTIHSVESALSCSSFSRSESSLPPSSA